MAAVFEKEVRYLRSRPMLLTLIMPRFVLVDLPHGIDESSPPLRRILQPRTPDRAFPAAAAYTLLMLTNLVYNNFGGDGGRHTVLLRVAGKFRDIVLGKNLTHASILAVEVPVAWIAVAFLYGRPATFDVTIATLCGLLFAAPLNFHGRQPAVSLLAEEAGFLDLRTAARIPDHGAGQPRRANRRGRHRRQHLRDRPPLRQLLDCDGGIPGAGGDFVLDLPNDSSPHRWHRAGAQGNTRGRTVPGRKKFLPRGSRVTFFSGFARKRYPTPRTVSRCRGCAGSSSM